MIRPSPTEDKAATLRGREVRLRGGIHIRRGQAYAGLRRVLSSAVARAFTRTSRREGSVSPESDLGGRGAAQDGHGARARTVRGKPPPAEACRLPAHRHRRRGRGRLLDGSRPDERRHRLRRGRAAGHRPPLGLGDDVLHPLRPPGLVAPARKPVRPAHDRRRVRELPREPLLGDQRPRVHVRAVPRPPAAGPLPPRVSRLPERASARALRASARRRRVRDRDLPRARPHVVRLLWPAQPARDLTRTRTRPSQPRASSSRSSARIA